MPQLQNEFSLTLKHKQAKGKTIIELYTSRVCKWYECEEEVVTKKLAQESLELKLRLQRYGGEGKIKLVGDKEMEWGRTTEILIHLARDFIKQTKGTLFLNN
jgi:hypothetical protein